LNDTMWFVALATEQVALMAKNRLHRISFHIWVWSFGGRRRLRYASFPLSAGRFAFELRDDG
jgi:hypothetical protein